MLAILPYIATSRSVKDDHVCMTVHNAIINYLLTIRTETLVCGSIVTLGDVYADSIVGTGRWETGILLLAMGTHEAWAALALIALLERRKNDAVNIS